MNKKALILYYSVTGNTEKVAQRFRRTLEDFGWECVTFKIEDGHRPADEGVYFDDFDLVLLGSPVHSCGPAAEVGRLLALSDVEPPRLYRAPYNVAGSPFKPDFPPLGVVFVTYSGNTYGPFESRGAIKLMSMYLEFSYINVIGEFACPGKPEHKGTLDVLAVELGISVLEAARILADYEKDPASCLSSGMSQDALELLSQCRQEKLTPAVSAPVASEEPWHKDNMLRPHERDLQKADIFLQEILEDYFRDLEGPRYSRSKYVCIG